MFEQATSRLALTVVACLAIAGGGFLLGTALGDGEVESDLGHPLSTISAESIENRIPTLSTVDSIPPLDVAEPVVETSAEDIAEEAPESSYPEGETEPEKTPVVPPPVTTPSQETTPPPEITVGTPE